jgi:DNA-binding NtrC family response regulator
MQDKEQSNKALIIDFVPNERKLLVKILHEYGYQVKEVKKIHEAAQLCKVEDFSLIISNLESSISEELKILDLVRHLGSKTRVVFITPHMEVETYIKARAKGAFDCIDKVLEESALREVIAGAKN